MTARTAPPVAAVVLAAGSSTRMGQNKLLLVLEGETLLRRAVRRALHAGLDPVIVVLGFEAERAQEELSGLACQIVVNARHGEGAQTSLKLGIATLPEKIAAAIVVLADMPLVSASMLAALAGCYAASRPRLVVSEYGGIVAPPTLYDRSLFAELLALEGGGGAGRPVLERHRHEAGQVAWPAECLTDLDEPGDYTRVMALIGREGTDRFNS